MALISAHQLMLRFGGDPLLDEVSVHIEAGERIALVGRNGSGKSTLMKVLAGEIRADQGEIQRASGLSVARLVQEVPSELSGTVFDIVASGPPGLGDLLSRYHQLSHAILEDSDLQKLQALQAEIEAKGAWELEQRVAAVLSRLKLPPEATFETLSGGLKRRVLLGRSLAAEPDLLLLDEPTNHLDIEAIEWMEELLLAFPGTLVFVTHDRSFLAKLATRILELDRGQLTSWPGSYPQFLAQKEQALVIEQEHNAKFDKKLANEEAWIRQGIQARRTRNEGRVRALKRLREQRRQRREVVGQARLQIESSERSGKMVIEAKKLCFAYPSNNEATASAPIIKDFSTRILSGDKIGILGANGSGKTTLLRLLLGDAEPSSGHLRHGARVEVAYFDQQREELDEQKSVADNVSDGNDKITIKGQTRHIISYLGDFLFEPAQTRTPVSALSGGERNRLMLARLFTRPFNLLVMDEPTNDLDVETLELLEALLVDFDGTLLLVSHDRSFLDHVVTSTLVMEGNGSVREYAGGYSDWLSQRPEAAAGPRKSRTPAAAGAKSSRQESKRTAQGGRKKLSYRQKRDLEALPQKIEALELEQTQLHEAFADPDFFRDKGPDGAVEAHERLALLEQELSVAYDQWAELEELADSGK